MKSATRIIPTSVGAITAIIVLVSLLVTMGGPANSAQVENTLQSVPASAAPVLDGSSGDTAWTAAPSISIPVSGGWYGSGAVTAKSVYKDGMVYFLYQYTDPDESVRYQPWQKQADGSWIRIPGTTSTSWSEKDPNAAGEDKLAIMWNVNDSIAGFNESGCAITCHWNDQGQFGTKFGRKYTNAPGEKADLWHLKSVRNSPVGQGDDQYIDDCAFNAACADYGRKTDPKLSGGYSNNYATGGTVPLYTSPTQPAPPYYILNSEKTAFVDTYSAGDEIASMIVSAMTGDRASLETRSSYDDATNTWTWEVTRPLVTPSQTDPAVPSPYDVQFSDLSGEYAFGVGVFDNVSVQHSTSSVYKLTFACNTPALSLSKSSVYWASYADYTSRILSVNYSVWNNGDNEAYNAQIVGTVNSNGVTSVNTPKWVERPSGYNIPVGTSGAATIKYHVPAGILAFSTHVYLTADDSCGTTHSYPVPMPGA